MHLAIVFLHMYELFGTRKNVKQQLCILEVDLGSLWIYWKVNPLAPFIVVLLVGALISIFIAMNVINRKLFINPFIKNKEKSVNRT